MNRARPSALRRLQQALFIFPIAVACAPAATPAPFPLHITVSTTAGAPVPAATIQINGHDAGTTNATGELRIASSSPEGSVMSLRVVCPAGYESASDSTSIALRRLATLDGTSSTPALRQRLICNATEQTSVVLVSSEPNLPLVINGTPQAITNASGIAHVTLRGKPNTPFELKLDTTPRPDLHPQNPTRTFTLNETATIFTFQQPLKAERARIRRAAKKPEPSVPYRID